MGAQWPLYLQQQAAAGLHPLAQRPVGDIPPVPVVPKTVPGDDGGRGRAAGSQDGSRGGTKVRKPYTITKQRERWTEEEHQRFLDALKLYGRAWRRIEEYIGTKTAVQIRSHAQKFFTKLEREASGKGSSGAQSGGGSAGDKAQSAGADKSDINIPPPRPKRKPSHPYPRKASTPSGQSGPTGDDADSQTVAAVAAAASAAAAAAAAAVVAAAGDAMSQKGHQAGPPFFGLPGLPPGLPPQVLRAIIAGAASKGAASAGLSGTSSGIDVSSMFPSTMSGPDLSAAAASFAPALHQGAGGLDMMPGRG